VTIHRRDLLKFACVAPAVVAAPGCGDDNVSIDTRLPVGPFGADSTAEEVTAGLDMTGKTALVTGCNSGIGFETLRVLALRGAHVIGTGRSLEKAQTACDSVQGNTTPMALELSDFDSCITCARQVAALGKPLDMLILNAGIGSFTDFGLVNGIEKIFVVNYLGHVVLTMNLLPQVEAAQAGRIVHVGSRMAYMSVPEGGIDFDNLRGEGEYTARLAYGRSKLANALFSLKLAQLLAGTDTTSNVVHPGFVKTNIGRNASGVIGFLYNSIADLLKKSPAEGAATQVYVATSPLLAGVSGAYFEDCNPVVINAPNYMFDRQLADRLWDETQVMLGGYLPGQA